jgi:hypothetical protein
VQDLLDCSVDQGLVILRHFKWNLDRLQNEWFANVSKLRIQIGLDFDPKINQLQPAHKISLRSHHQGYCQVCYSQFNSGKDTQPDSLHCGHEFC